MIKVTRFQPSTCNCIVHYEWDTDVNEDARVHTVTEVEVCDKHKNYKLEPGTTMENDKCIPVVENKQANIVVH